MSINPTSQWSPVSLEPALIRLNAADDMQEFWEATKALLHVTLPIEFCCLCFRPFIVMPPTVFRERAPFADNAEFQRFQELCPFSAYIERHPSVRVVRLSDVIETSKLLKTEFFRAFMQPCGDRYQAYIVLWESDVFQGLVGLHRTMPQRDFTDTEIRLLEQLYPHFQNTARHVLTSHREKARRMSLEVLLRRLPIATIILDWDLKVTYRNAAAEELGILWNLGPQAARSLKSAQHFEIPAEIVESCRSVKNTWRPPEGPRDASGSGYEFLIEHPTLAGLRATVNLLQMDAAPLSLPMFLVRLESRDGCLGENDDALTDNQLALWANLSRSEQRVAWLASQGHQNAEIARRLNKSALTVKKQLQSIYEKLDVPGRNRLIALMRSGPRSGFESRSPMGSLSEQVARAKPTSNAGPKRPTG
ncbi:MAG: helix-turn-helix transcriptional regulator [Verrucomicrobia bacterium]|nr:helix-turn-helix transcriptional regulator [Verrucomicrobiota bacterium]